MTSKRELSEQAKREKRRLAYLRAKTNEDAEHRDAILEKATTHDAHVRASETPENRETRLEKKRLHQSSVRASELVATKVVPLERDKVQHSNVKTLELPVRKSARLQAKRDARAICYCQGGRVTCSTTCCSTRTSSRLNKASF